MPKELFEIKDWRTGTLTTPSKKDLPPDAAQHSLNLDPLAEDGKLMGIEAHSIMTTSGWAVSGTTGLSGFDGEYVSVINNKGIRTLVFYDHDTNQFKFIEDLDATESVSIDNIGDTQDVSNNAYMTPNNSELHIGRGDLEPLWIGYTQYKQFGVDASDELILESAKLDTSSSLDAFYKVVSIVEGSPPIRYFYAVKYGGQYVYKFQQSGVNSFTLLQKSAHLFGRIQGLCLRHEGISAQVDGLYVDPVLWVYDAGVGEYGTMYKYNGTSLLTAGEHALSDGPDREYTDTVDSAITDILEHDGILWFGRGYDGNTEFKDDLIWNCPIPDSGSPCALVNRTPKLIDFFGVESVGEASDLAGWITTSQQGNFNLIPVDNLTVEESGGTYQCFSVMMEASRKSTPYGSFGGGNDDPKAAFYTPGDGYEPGDAVGYNMGVAGHTAYLNQTFITDAVGCSMVNSCDEIGPLFGDYWSNNPPEPRNQSSKFNELLGWNWTTMPTTMYQGGSSGTANNWGQEDGLGTENTHVQNLYITTKPGFDHDDIPYQWHGYHANAGWYDPKGSKIVDNDYLLSPGYGETSKALRHYYHGCQTEFQHSPRDWIDKDWGLVFWGSNNFKGHEAEKAIGTYVDLAGDAAEALKTGWAAGDDTHLDYRRGGQTQIDHNLYARAYNYTENPGAFDIKSNGLIGLELIESNDAEFNYTDGDWVLKATGGYEHISGTTTLSYIAPTDTLVNGIKYHITFSSIGRTAGTIGFKVGNTATASLDDAAYTDEEIITGDIDATWDGTADPTIDYSTIVLQVIPTNDWDGTITKLEVQAEPHTHSIILPTSYNNLGVGTPANTLLSPIGVNYTTPGYRHTKNYPSFNMSTDYNQGYALHTVDGGDQQYQEFGTTNHDESYFPRGTGEVLSVRTGMGAMKVRREATLTNPLNLTNGWHLNDFAGQHMPFDRHIMTVDSVNKLIFVVNPLHKGYGFPNTDICEIDTGALTTHCIENNDLSIASVTLVGGSTEVTDCSTTNLWVGMTIGGVVLTGDARIETGTYITSIESATAFQMSKEIKGTPAGTEDCTISFGKYISTDQGTGGNRNVIYIYSYDQHGKMTYKGFKHIIRDCLPDYRGKNGLPGGCNSDKAIIPTDIYCRGTAGGNNYLIINVMNMLDGWDSAWENQEGGGRIAVSDSSKNNALVHNVLRVQYNSDLTEWTPSNTQKSLLQMNSWGEDLEPSSGNHLLNEDHGWGSGAKVNESIGQYSQGGGGHYLAQTAFCKASLVLFKVQWHNMWAQSPVNIEDRKCRVRGVATRITDEKIHTPLQRWGDLMLTDPAFYSISDLDPEMGHSSIPTDKEPFTEYNSPIDFIALDDASRVLYVATSQRVNHVKKETANDRHEDAVITYTSIQSFSYIDKLGVPWSDEDTADEIWENLRRKGDHGPAIDHIVISSINNHAGANSFEDEYDTGKFRNCNPYGTYYRQGIVTDNQTRRDVKYYNEDGEPLDNVTENFVDSKGVKEELPRGRYLILCGGGSSISNIKISEAGNPDFQRHDPNTMAQLRAIPVTVQGKFIKHSTRKREQEFFGSTGVIQHETSNSKPWDITAGTYTLSRTNRWGMFNSEGDEMSDSDTDDSLYTPYTTCIKDQDVWLQKRSLDGPMIGWDEDIGTLFTMAGMRAGNDEIDSGICGFNHDDNTAAEDIYRCFRLQSISFMHHHPISSPLVNLFSARADDPHFCGGVIFGVQNRNMIHAKILKGDSTLTEFDTSTKRHENSNTLQTISTTHGRWILGIIDKDQAKGESNEIVTAEKKADGATAGESRLFGVGKDYEGYILGRVTSRSSSHSAAYAYMNMTMVKGISQVYDDTLLNIGPSVDYRYLITFGRHRWYSHDYLADKAGLGILSGGDPFVSSAIGLAMAHGTEIDIMHNGGYGHLNGACFMKDPFPIGLKYDVVGSQVAENSYDIDVHLFIGNSYNSDLQTNSRNAGWALGLMDRHTSINSSLYLNENDSINTGGKLADTIDISVENIDSGDWSTSNDKYFYRASFLYDGYQEGPLGDDYPLASSTGKDIKLTIKIDTSNLSKRVTHVNIYRGQNSNSNATRPLGFYRLVDSVRMDSQWSTGSDPVPSPNFAGYRELTYTDTGYSGADYESSSGIPEVIDDSSLKYFYSCELNNQLYVAKIGHRMMDNGENTIAKSLPYNYDMFDITKDILRLPSTPTGIAEYGMRIWVFDEGNTYKIEPSNLYIEETYQGTGCFGPDSYVSCEAGLFFCDKNNLYSCSQGFPVSIGTSIRTGGTYSWDNMDPDYLPKVGFDGKRKTVLFIFKLSGADEYYAWGYNMYATRWDLYSLGSTPISNITNDKYGNLLYNAGGYLYQFGTDKTQHMDWEWVSKRFTLGHDNVNKKFYEVKNLGDGTITYGINGAPTATGLTGEKIASGDRKAKDITLKVASGTNAANKYKVDSLGLIFRRLKVTSG